MSTGRSTRRVDVTRIAYRAKGASNLHPGDAALNLPVEMHSHGLRRAAAEQAVRRSFDTARDQINQTTEVGIGKRQVEAQPTPLTERPTSAPHRQRGQPRHRRHPGSNPTPAARPAAIPQPTATPPPPLCLNCVDGLVKVPG
jgi:hypothetical protein